MKKKYTLIFTFLILAIAFFYVFTSVPKPRNIHITGLTMGKIAYNIKCLGNVSEEKMKFKIDSLLKELNQSLSTYIFNSELSTLNKNGSMDKPSDFLRTVLISSKEVFDNTEGAFDPTIGKLVNSWGFGPAKKKEAMDSVRVDFFLNYVGFDHVYFDENTVRIKQDIALDFSAIAKGMAVDLLATLLEKNSLKNYMIEIGGEVRCKGLNPENKTWKIGIEDPTVEREEQRLFAILEVKDNSLATSGNYRNFYEKNGKIFSHLINPTTGFPNQNNMLSATVIMNECIKADAYATAFMVMDLEKSIRIIESSEEMDAILLYYDQKKLKSYVSKGIVNKIKYIH